MVPAFDEKTFRDWKVSLLLLRKVSKGRSNAPLCSILND